MHTIVRTLKNRWREIGAVTGIFTILASVACLIIFHGRLDATTHSDIERVMLFGLAIYALSLFFKVYGQNKQQKPRIHVWEHNGLTMVAPATEMEIGVQIRERRRLALHPHKTMQHRIAPPLYALFSDNRQRLMDEAVYPMCDYRVLEKRCIVVRTEMEMPNLDKEGAGAGALNRSELWRLITGDHNAEFPNEPAIA